MIHPTNKAAEIARLIRLDPVAAGQISEHIGPAELRDLLSIDKSTEEFFEDVTNEQLWSELGDRIAAANYVMTPELEEAIAIVKDSIL